MRYHRKEHPEITQEAEESKELLERANPNPPQVEKKLEDAEEPLKRKTNRGRISSAIRTRGKLETRGKRRQSKNCLLCKELHPKGLGERLDRECNRRLCWG